MVGHVLEYHPAARRLLSLLRAGRIGDVSSVWCERTSKLTVDRTGDPLWELGPHDVSLLRLIFGCAPLTVSARRHASGLVSAKLSYHGGAQAHLTLGRSVDSVKKRRCVVVGSTGVAVFDDADAHAGLRVYPAQAGLRERVERARHALATATELAPFAPDLEGLSCLAFSPPGEPLAIEAAHFVRAVHTGSVQSDVQSGVAAVTVLEAAARSLEQHGARVVVDLDVGPQDSTAGYV
jgi:predicted dehydrogenase